MATPGTRHHCQHTRHQRNSFLCCCAGAGPRLGPVPLLASHPIPYTAINITRTSLSQLRKHFAPALNTFASLRSYIYVCVRVYWMDGRNPAMYRRTARSLEPFICIIISTFGISGYPDTDFRSLKVGFIQQTLFCCWRCCCDAPIKVIVGRICCLLSLTLMEIACERLWSII